MPLSGTVAANKGLGYTPILLCSIRFHGTSTPLLLSTHPFDGVNGPAFPGRGTAPAGNYIGRIAEQDIETIQHRSQLGIDRVPKVTLHLFDGDFYLFNNYAKAYGFRGATMKIWLVLWESGTSNFTSDAPLLFTGTCDMEVPVQGMTTLLVSANTGHNTATVKLPMFPIQNRCPLLFPPDAAARQAAKDDPTSPYYACGYSADISGGVGNTAAPNIFKNGVRMTDGNGVFVACDFIRSDKTRSDQTRGCMARLGNYGLTNVAPDGDLMHDTSNRRTGRFAGIQWSPGTYYAWEKNYTSNSRIATFSFANSAVWGDYIPLLYGRQFVNCKVANVVESGNDTKCEAIICVGDLDPSGGPWPHRNPDLVLVNGIQLGEDPTGDKNLFWAFATDGIGNFGTGGRNGVALKGHTGYMNSTHNALGDPYGSIARILCVFYKDIFTGFGTPTIQVRAVGPKVRKFDAAGALDGFSDDTNPAWILADILLKANWDKSEINWQSFIDSANFCATDITYTDASGNAAATHARYRCSFALETRRTAAEVIAGVLRGFNAYLYYDPSTGLLSLGMLQTLADQQASPVTGSNYNTGIASIHADGTAGTGYAAYWFNDGNISLIGPEDDQYLDIEWIESATINTPNQIHIQFQDEDNQYVVDSLSEIDPESVRRAGGALQPGGSVVPDTPPILGICNFDQAVRVANTILAERQFGNENNDGRGTRTCVIGTTVQAAHLRVGHLVVMSLEHIGLDKQLFRVTGIKPMTDCEGIKITLQWENEIWRTDAYGQTPQAFYSQPGNGRLNRIPLIWQPYGTQPKVPAADVFPKISTTEWTYRIAEIDDTDASGAPLIRLRVSGNLPINQISADCQPPRVPTSVTVSTSGGTIRGGQSLLISICAKDASGKYSGPSGFMRAPVPTTTNNNSITINNLAWMDGTDSWDVFVGTDGFNMTSQLTGTGTPASITITALPNALKYGMPDPAAAAAWVNVRNVKHAGVIGSEIIAVSGNTVTIGAPASGTLSGSLASHKLMLLGRPNNSGNDLDFVMYNIVSYVNNGSNPVFTLDRSVGSDMQVGDVVIVSAQATIHAVNKIGDYRLVSAYAPNGVESSDVGQVIRIIEGKGRYQQRIVLDIEESGGVGTGYDTYIVSDWEVEPDETSMFILEEPKADTFEVGRFTTTSLVDVALAEVEVSNFGQEALIITPMLADSTQTRFSSLDRSPWRMLWLTGVQGTRVVDYNTGAGMRTTDRIIKFDTSGVTQPAATTLAADIDDVTQDVVLTSGTNAVNGTIILTGSERMFVLSGGGTANLSVIRGWGGTTAATHTSGTTVTLPGALNWTLVSFALVPNQEFIFSKISTDINYVKLIPYSGPGVTDELPDGESAHILADSSADYGTYVIKVPAV